MRPRQENENCEVSSKGIRLFSLHNRVRANRPCEAWLHTYTFMRNREAFRASFMPLFLCDAFSAGTWYFLVGFLIFKLIP